MQKLHIFIVKNFGEYNEENKYHVVSTPFKGIYYVEFENKYFLGLSIKIFADRTHTEQVDNFKLVIDSRKVFGQNNSKNHFFVFETVIKTILNLFACYFKCHTDIIFTSFPWYILKFCKRNPIKGNIF
jgi:hypothetical protein